MIFFWRRQEEVQAGEEDEWEAMLDAMGVARPSTRLMLLDRPPRCGSCGARLPLDMSAIEKHSKECFGSPKKGDLSFRSGAKVLQGTNFVGDVAIVRLLGSLFPGPF